MIDEPERTDSGRRHLAWLGHPITVVALVLGLPVRGSDRPVDNVR